MTCARRPGCRSDAACRGHYHRPRFSSCTRASGPAAPPAWTGATAAAATTAALAMMMVTPSPSWASIPLQPMQREGPGAFSQEEALRQLGAVRPGTSAAPAPAAPSATQRQAAQLPAPELSCLPPGLLQATLSSQATSSAPPLQASPPAALEPSASPSTPPGISTPSPSSTESTADRILATFSSQATTTSQTADSGASSGQRVRKALTCLQEARSAADDRQYGKALLLYSFTAAENPDLALASYARVGRAMMLYQAGQTSDAILALEDESVAMVGSAEIHAALAALLYAERPTLAFRAEEEWEIASSFDKRYSNLEFVRSKHWPDRMVAALSRFLTMQRGSAL